MPEQEMPRYIGPDTSGRKDKLTRQEIKDRFDREVAALYAKREPVWLPESGGIFDLIVDVISPFLEAGGYILDIGAGTGNLTQTILERVPSARATLLDFSENMLSQAPRVLSAFAGRFDAIVSDFIQDELPDRRYHAVVSSFAIHHCRSEAEYLALYKKIRNVLKKPGIFVCCDVVNGASDSLSQLNETGWAGFLTAAGVSREEIDKILSNYRVEDSPASLPVHLRLLSEAGFAIVDVLWKKYNFAVYAGLVG